MEQSNSISLWIEGKTRSGKTTRLVTEFSQWVRQRVIEQNDPQHPQDSLTSAILVFAANNNNRLSLDNYYYPKKRSPIYLK